MWKDFFYYSKSERRAILLLLTVAVSGLIIYWISYQKQDTSICHKEHVSVDSFQRQLRLQEKRMHSYHRSLKKKNKPERKVVLQNFNPNTADSLTLRQLGLSDFVIRNILRYREKGGSFRTSESFSKIYGLSSEQYRTLHPYIQIPAPKIALPVDTAPHLPSLQPDTAALKYAEGTKVDLNRADTSILKRVPGIGSFLARRIVAYRDRLGGFYRVEQLQEVMHVDTVVNKWFRVDSCGMRRLEVNRASLDELRRHPYMDFYKAKAILEYRRKRGKIKGLSRLALFEEFSGKDLERLLPYLSFD